MAELNKYGMEQALINFEITNISPFEWVIQSIHQDTNLITQIDNYMFRVNRNGLYIINPLNSDISVDIGASEPFTIQSNHALIYDDDNQISGLFFTMFLNQTQNISGNIFLPLITTLKNNFNLNIRSSFASSIGEIYLQFIKLQDLKLDMLPINF